MKTEITQKQVDDAWEKAWVKARKIRDKALEDWEKAWDKVQELRRKFEEQEAQDGN